jgi:PAS domain S-box-containing protein
MAQIAVSRLKKCVVTSIKYCGAAIAAGRRAPEMTLRQTSGSEASLAEAGTCACSSAADEGFASSGVREWNLIEALADSAPVAIYHADGAGHLTYANPQYRAMFGLTDGQSLDDWAKAVHPIDRPRIEAIWADFFRDSAATTQFEYRTLACSGETRNLAEHVVAVTAEGVSGFVGTITDVTELKQAQDELEILHRQLVHASRLAGRAEVATNILHNVGNVLNSVNVSADLASARIKNSKLSSLHRVVDLLRAKDTDLAAFFRDDERSRRLPAYLGKLAGQLVADQNQVLAELAALKNGIDHIKDIVAMQQNYARLGGVADVVDVVTLVEDSLHLNEGALTRHGVIVRREFDEVPQIVVDKHRVLQILVNLIRNAKEACAESEREDKVVLVRVTIDGSRLQISVKDNGVGIAPENLTRIFNHGFTTKKEGHGFGLHSGALTAIELGGELRVQSDGQGHGAVFTLCLPLTAAQANHE